MTDVIIKKRGRKKQDFTGRKFGRLTAIKFSRFGVSRNGNPHEFWIFSCSCDPAKEVEFAKRNVLTGRCNSCGCLKKESANGRKPKHGFAVRRNSAGKDYALNKFYMAWRGMLQRVNHPNYIAKGLKLEDERWRSFENFRDDMLSQWKEKTQLDRIDNNQGYRKDNCRFISRKENMNNTSFNKIVWYKNEKYTVSQLADKIGMPPGTLSTRINRGWTVEESVERPLGSFMPVNKIWKTTNYISRAERKLPGPVIGPLSQYLIPMSWCI